MSRGHRTYIEVRGGTPNKKRRLRKITRAARKRNRV